MDVFDEYIRAHCVPLYVCIYLILSERFEDLGLVEARDGVGVTQLGGSVQQPQGSHVVLLTKLDLVAAKGRWEEGVRI